jgi:hypothetical protein
VELSVEKQRCVCSALPLQVVTSPHVDHRGLSNF